MLYKSKCQQQPTWYYQSTVPSWGWTQTHAWTLTVSPRGMTFLIHKREIFHLIGWVSSNWQNFRYISLFNLLFYRFFNRTNNLSILVVTLILFSNDSDAHRDWSVRLFCHCLSLSVHIYYLVHLFVILWFNLPFYQSQGNYSSLVFNLIHLSTSYQSIWLNFLCLSIFPAIYQSGSSYLSSILYLSVSCIKKYISK